LQSPEIRAVLSRFWKEGDEATRLKRRLVFLARGGAATERDYPFPNGRPGLAYWTAAAIDENTAPLRGIA
jgi:hypothetical protein